MTRDYGHRRPARRGANSPNLFLVSVVTFVMGYFSATVMDFEKLTHWISAQILAGSKPEVGHPKPTPAPVAQASAKPKFEFYTLLANDKVQNPSSSLTGTGTHEELKPKVVSKLVTPSTIAAKSAAQQSQAAAVVQIVEARPIVPVSPPQKGSYSVQVASFKTREDAERVRGLLALKGFDVRVIGVVRAQRAWFRVLVGPYSSKILAQQAQARLAKSEHLQGMVTQV